MKFLPVLTVTIAALLLLAGVAVIALDDRAEASVLTLFSSETELRNYLEKHAPGNGGSRDMSGYATAEAAASSGTNTQVKGVDESDLVKTDGELIFIADGSTVHIIGTQPSLSNVTDLEVGNGSENCYTNIDGLFLWNGHLIVIQTVFEYQPVQPYQGKDGEAFLCYPCWSSQRTAVLVYDLDDPRAPVLVSSGGMTGSVMTTRMIGGTVYVVAHQSIWSGEDVQLPERTANGADQGIEATAISYDPSCPEISYFVNLLAFNVSSGQVNSLTALAAPSSVTYMSETSLDLTMLHWSDTGPFSSAPSQAITQIYRVAVSGTDLALAAQGAVDGAPLNQFALDERDGRLRIATTTAASEPANSVHVLDLDLKEVGSLSGIASGERIYSCRYLDDRLYMVTFRQVDPLFAIDLSSDAPIVLGELKVPGASTYLQMVDEGLLGIGFENGSVKVSLYNITDPGDLREIGSYVVDGFSYSAAQYDHHAVLYEPSNGLLVIPLTTYGGWTVDSWVSYRPWSAALVLSVGADGISRAGTVVHDNATVERSLSIGDVLYTISDTTVKASSLSSMELLDQIIYSDGRQYYYGWTGPAEPMLVN